MSFDTRKSSVLKDSVGVLKVIHKYCRIPFRLRICQILVMSVKPALSVLILEKLIDNTQLLMCQEKNSVMLWMFLLISLSILYSVAISMESYISILLEKKLNESFSEQILEKYLRIPYQCFEEPEIQDLRRCEIFSVNSDLL